MLNGIAIGAETVARLTEKCTERGIDLEAIGLTEAAEGVPDEVAPQKLTLMKRTAARQLQSVKGIIVRQPLLKACWRPRGGHPLACVVTATVTENEIRIGSESASETETGIATVNVNVNATEIAIEIVTGSGSGSVIETANETETEIETVSGIMTDMADLAGTTTRTMTVTARVAMKSARECTDAEQSGVVRTTNFRMETSARQPAAAVPMKTRSVEIPR